MLNVPISSSENSFRVAFGGTVTCGRVWVLRDQTLIVRRVRPTRRELGTIPVVGMSDIAVHGYGNLCTVLLRVLIGGFWD